MQMHANHRSLTNASLCLHLCVYAVRFHARVFASQVALPVSSYWHALLVAEARGGEAV